MKNYYSAISTCLASCGIDHKTLVARENRPKKEDLLPVEYDPEDVKIFLAACSSEQHSLVFETFLKTGCREQELAFLEWTDLNLGTSNITIQGEKRLALLVNGKPKLSGFEPRHGSRAKFRLSQRLHQSLKRGKAKTPKLALSSVLRQICPTVTSSLQ